MGRSIVRVINNDAHTRPATAASAQTDSEIVLSSFDVLTGQNWSQKKRRRRRGSCFVLPEDLSDDAQPHRRVSSPLFVSRSPFSETDRRPHGQPHWLAGEVAQTTTTTTTTRAQIPSCWTVRKKRGSLWRGQDVAGGGSSEERGRIKEICHESRRAKRRKVDGCLAKCYDWIASSRFAICFSLTIRIRIIFIFSGALINRRWRQTTTPCMHALAQVATMDAAGNMPSFVVKQLIRPFVMQDHGDITKYYF